MIPAGSITVANSNGETFQWIVTDDEGYILGLPPMPGVVDFDGAGAGVCNIWHLAYDGDITGLAPGLNANDLAGCFSLSAPIQVTRTNADGCQANGGDLFGGPFEFTVGDGVADTIPAGSITLANSNGDSQWIVTDDEGNILGLPPMPSVVNFDGAGAGVCFVYHLSSVGDITGLAPGSNIAGIEGCHHISNAIEVIRTAEGDCQANGGELFGGPFEFCVGDDEADFISADSITVVNTNGENFQWIVTDESGNILGLPPTFTAVDFDGAGGGTCQIWYLAYDGEISGLEVDANTANLEGCFSLSNPISVIRDADCTGLIGEEEEVVEEEVVVEEERLVSVNVYPIPSTTTLTVDVETGGEIDNDIIIVDLLGNIVHTQSNIKKNETIDISNLTPGRYVLRVNKGKYQMISKVFIKM